MNIFYKILNHNIYKIIELLILSSTVPFLVLVMKLYNLVIPVLWIVTLYCLLIYFFKNRQVKFKFKNIFNFNFKILFKILARWVLVSIILYLLTYYFFIDKLFIIQKNKPEILWKIMLLYPLFSALFTSISSISLPRFDLVNIRNIGCICL